MCILLMRLKVILFQLYVSANLGLLEMPANLLADSGALVSRGYNHLVYHQKII